MAGVGGRRAPFFMLSGRADSVEETTLDPREAGRPTWADIDLEALAANFDVVRRRVGPQVKVMAVVKADAYGHGAARCARRLEAEGAD